MSLASNYVQVLKEGVDEKKVVAHMKAKGHLSLLPTVLRILKREKQRPETVTITAKDDPRIVGGTITLKGFTLIDASYRKALVDLYKRSTAY
jgi:hypothetical protein